MKSIYKKFINFVKYHNAFAIIFVIGFMSFSITFAASPEARDAVFKKQEQEMGIDNAMLLQASVSDWDFMPRILNIEQDNTYYYVEYEFETLGIVDNVWQKTTKENLLKFEVESDRYTDVSAYITKEIKEVIAHEKRLLEDSQKIAKEQGVTKKVKVVKYSGLVGKVLSLKDKVVVQETPTSASSTQKLASNEEEPKQDTKQDKDFIAQVVEEVLAEKGLLAQNTQQNTQQNTENSSNTDTNQSQDNTSSDTSGSGNQASDTELTAIDVYVTTTKNNPREITLEASKQDSNFVTTSGASNGELSSVEGNKVIYTPKEDFIGDDQFTFQAYVNTTHSENAWVYIEVIDDQSTTTATTTEDTSTTTEPVSATTTPTCDVEHLDLCDSENKCLEAELYWYDNACNLEAPPACDSNNLNLCTTEIDCQNASGYWYDEICNSEPQQTCDNTHLNLCLTELDCQSASGYWYNDICNTEACVLNWQCTEWQPLPDTVCLGEIFIQTRTCEDINDCGVEDNKPEESQEATGTMDCTATSTDSN